MNKLKNTNYSLRFDSPGPNTKTRHISELDIKQNDESEKENIIKNQITSKANANTKSSKTNNNENSSNNNNNIANESAKKNINKFNKISKENNTLFACLNSEVASS